MSLFLLVEVATVEDRARILGLPQREDEEWRGVTVQVTDVTCISRATLDRWLLPPEQTYEVQKKVQRTQRVKHRPKT